MRKRTLTLMPAALAAAGLAAALAAGLLAGGCEDVSYDESVWNKTSGSFTVTFNWDYAGAPSPEKQTVTKGKSITLLEGSREGYVLNQWVTKDYYYPVGKPGASYTPTGSVTLLAGWVPTFTLTFDKQGGSGGDDNVLAVNMEPLPDIDPPAREGYIFHGYFEETEGRGHRFYREDGTHGELWEGSFVSRTIYAYWEKKFGYGEQFLVTFDHRSGLPDDIEVTGNMPATVMATYGEEMPGISVPDQISGWTLQGYRSEPGGEGERYYYAFGNSARKWDIYGPATLYADWRQNLARD